MGKVKSFVENYSKIIEVSFSFISLLIVGVIGTTISINNSITSRASLELSRAQSQPTFVVRSEKNVGTDAENASEDITVEVSNGFAENVDVKVNAWLSFSYEEDGKTIEKKAHLSDYFPSLYYSGNNRGQILTIKDEKSYGKILKIRKEIFDDTKEKTYALTKFNNMSLKVIVAISYQDISGNDYVKYYESKNDLYNHIDDAAGEAIMKDINNMPKILMADLSIEELDKL